MKFKNVAITGGAGYVGSALVPHLINLGYEVKVIDLFLYGERVFDDLDGSPKFKKIKGDIRDEGMLRRELREMDAVIHLACISNDPSFELNPKLGKSINYDAFFGLLRAVRENNIQRFMFASSSSVYGVKKEPEVREESFLEPLTDYSKYKVLCEEVLRREGIGNGDFVILRPATVCGYAPRLRLDLTVNILTINALVRKEIRVFGGRQLRPNIHMKDIVSLYQLLLEADSSKIHGQTFNAGYQNLSVDEIARLVRDQIGDSEVTIQYQPTDDLRSYHINSEKIWRELGFKPQHTLQEAVGSLQEAFQEGKIQSPLENPLYYNIKRMQQVNLA